MPIMANGKINCEALPIVLKEVNLMGLMIREGTLQELDFLVETRIEVLRNVFSLSPNQDMSDLAQASREYYKRAIPKGEHIACLAFENGLFAGCGGICLYREMPLPDNITGLCGYLMNIYTRSEFRRKGIGKGMVRWLVEQGRRQGAEKIYLDASDMGRPLYENMGFVPMKNSMHLPIGTVIND